MKRLALWTTSILVATTVVARAQGPTLPPDDEGSGSAGSSSEPPTTPPPASGATAGGAAPAVDPAAPAPAPPTAPEGAIGEDPYAPVIPSGPPPPPLPPIPQPEVLAVPTGWILPAAVLYTKVGLDTGGGVSADSRIGLGDVAEFGVSTTDAVRERTDDADLTPSRIQPYFAATFRMGLAERRLFAAQPAVALGFRKSFERHHDGYQTRIAELTLVASKHVGDRFAFHVGGSFWDASLAGPIDGESGGPRTITLHGFNELGRQLRPFGGIEIEPLPHSQILVDVGWAPELCYLCTNPGGTNADGRKIRLRPVLSWGVRYFVTRGTRIEAGVRVPDIGDANLLDAQIFGQAVFTAGGLRKAIARAR